jgi:hypothetical protein
MRAKDPVVWILGLKSPNVDSSTLWHSTMTGVVLKISAYTMKQHVLTGIEMAGKNGVR